MTKAEAAIIARDLTGSGDGWEYVVEEIKGAIKIVAFDEEGNRLGPI